MSLKPKPIDGYEDNYYLDPENMAVVNKKTGRVLKPRVDNAGYPEVQLWKNNKGTHKRLHRLFAEAYIPNPDDLPCVNHKDEDIENYNLDNLEWCTLSYNQRYNKINERRGRKISKALSGKPKPWIAEQKSIPVLCIDSLGNETYFASAREAGRILGIDQSSITAVVKGRSKTVHGYIFKYAD